MSNRTLASPASEAQLRFVNGLLADREVSDDLRARATRPDLTDGDCRRIIPLLQECPSRSYGGADDEDSPDMGVHRFDGGGSW